MARMDRPRFIGSIACRLASSRASSPPPFVLCQFGKIEQEADRVRIKGNYCTATGTIRRDGHLVHK